MNPLAILVAPIAMLLPGAAAVDGAREVSEPVEVSAEDNAYAPPQGPMSVPEGFDAGPWQSLITTFELPGQRQVRIEQVLTIRVAPRAPTTEPAMLAALPQGGMPNRMTERRMGRCVPMGGIVGMQYGGDRKLILYLRDRRIVSATLQKACRARDFYSGFYVARNGDGMLCSDRDELQSRSGANCQVEGFKQLVATDD